jgi:nucleoside-diphosphate-sugar epimerase
MSEKFTVFGADGFVGRRLVSRLQRDGHSVTSVSRGDEINLKSVDLGHVMYCVGVTGSRFKTEQFNVVDAHVSSMARVLERGQFSSFLYMSSARVYEESLTDTSETARFSVDPSTISDFYNLSKLMGESLILNAGPPTSRIARVSYAVDFAEDSTDNLTVFIRSALRGTVCFEADEQSVKDYVVMDDLLSVLPRIALAGCSRIYNVAGGVNVSTREIADMLSGETGCTVEFAGGEPKRSPKVVDVSRLSSEFSYRPSSLLEYARRVIKKELVR